MQAEIKGTTMPVLEMILEPGEAVVSDHGELSWMTANMQMSQTANAGQGGHGIMGGLKRAMGGGSIMLTRYEPSGSQGMVAFAAKVPGHILPLEIAPSQGYLVHRRGWLCGTVGINPTVGFQQSLGGALFGGEGFVLQRLEGQGTAWVELSGEMTSYDLVAGQSLLVHPGHIGAFQESVQFQLTRIQGVTNRFFGANGYWIVALTGPGKIWLQSMPLPILASALQPYLAAQGAAVEQGAVGGIFGGMMRN